MARSDSKKKSFIKQNITDVPGHGNVEETEELFERRLVHCVHQTHLTDQEIQDTAAGGNWKRKNITVKYIAWKNKCLNHDMSSLCTVMFHKE